MSVWSCNEWDPLKEIIIGTAQGAHYEHDPMLQIMLILQKKNIIHAQRYIPEHVYPRSRRRLRRTGWCIRRLGVKVHRSI